MTGVARRGDAGGMIDPQAARSIIVRHRPDSEEHGDTCQSCGRPWPCDVARLATAAGIPDGLGAAGRVMIVARRTRLTPALRSHLPAVTAGIGTLLPRRVVLQPV